MGTLLPVDVELRLGGLPLPPSRVSVVDRDPFGLTTTALTVEVKWRRNGTQVKDGQCRFGRSFLDWPGISTWRQLVEGESKCFMDGKKTTVTGFARQNWYNDNFADYWEGAVQLCGKPPLPDTIADIQGYVVGGTKGGVSFWGAGVPGGGCSSLLRYAAERHPMHRRGRVPVDTSTIPAYGQPFLLFAPKIYSRNKVSRWHRAS